MAGMLETRPDWCLSRQRLWGVPIPAVKCQDCQEVILNETVVANAGEIFLKNGSDSWFSRGIEDFLPPDFKCPKCNRRQFVKEFDILDVWFESGASFDPVLKNNPDLNFPSQMYLEGSDQHRGWFQVSLILAAAKENAPPFGEILTHGFVVDGEGRKMSKSLGNVIGPQEIIKQYGAEILRLWVAYSDFSEDVKISQNLLKQLVDIYRKVRNTIKFILGNLYDYDSQKTCPKYQDLLEVDKYMLARTMLVAKEIMAAYENYSFYKACQELFNFCNLDLSSFYLDILKDRLYTFSPNSVGRRSAQFAISHILNVLLKLIAPILPFTAEEAYLSYKSLSGRKESIFFTSFDEVYHCEWINEDLLALWHKVLALRPQVLKKIEVLRENAGIGSSLEADVELKFKGAEFNFYKKYQDSLREIFIVSQVDIEEGEEEIKVKKTNAKKCSRCWNFRKDVGEDKKHPDICKRCVEALKNEKSFREERT
jgi:isoleucyl-tRNA synthetase